MHNIVEIQLFSSLENWLYSWEVLLNLYMALANIGITSVVVRYDVFISYFSLRVHFDYYFLFILPFYRTPIYKWYSYKSLLEALVCINPLSFVIFKQGFKYPNVYIFNHLVEVLVQSSGELQMPRLTVEQSNINQCLPDKKSLQDKRIILLRLHALHLEPALKKYHEMNSSLYYFTGGPVLDNAQALQYISALTINNMTS